MTQLQSGFINTGTSTPTGNPMQVAVDNPYMTKDEFVASFEAAGLGFTVNSPQYASGTLDQTLLDASSFVNRHCRRWFDTQTVDQQDTGFMVRPYNPQLTTVILKNSPYTQINSIYIQVLQWYVEIISSGPGSYLQNFFDKGFYKIVPLLSTAGTGLGTPIPAAILDRAPLGVLWTNYTFGYGTPLATQTLTQIGSTLQYQAPLGNRLWAPSQPFSVYANSVLQVTSAYTVDYPNGIVTFNTTPASPITANFTTNESLPSEIKRATLLYACHLIGQAGANPFGADSYGIQTYNVRFGDKSNVLKRVEELLQPYVMQLPAFIGF